MKLFKRTLCLVMAALMIFSMAACAKKETPVPDEPKGDEPQYGGIFHLAKTTSPTSLFPAYLAVNGGGYLSPCLETLAFEDPATNELKCRLLESFEFDSENCIVTGKLREGVMFHDGSELTSEVVKWNYDFRKENGQSATIYDVDVEVTGKYTFKMTFPKYHLDGANVLVQSMCSKEAYEKEGLDYCMAHPVGTGAFKFVEYVPDLKIVYEKNENYWQPGLPYLDGYQIDILDMNTVTTAFLNGDIHTLEQANAQMCQMIEAEGFKDVHEIVFGNNSIYGFAPNTKVEGDPWANIDVRRAVMLYGINYAEVAVLAGGPLAEEMHTFDYPGALANDPALNDYYKYDLEKAKSMLAEAGYANGFETTIYAQQTFKSFATVLQDQLKNLNITASVELIQSADPRRTDGKTPGLFISLQNSAWDIIAKPVGTIYHQTGNTQGKNIKFSDEYEALWQKALAAKSYEERAEYGKQLLHMLAYDECLYAVAYGRGANVYIRDDAHDTGNEYKTPAPATTWLSQPTQK